MCSENRTYTGRGPPRTITRLRLPTTTVRYMTDGRSSLGIFYPCAHAGYGREREWTPNDDRATGRVEGVTVKANKKPVFKVDTFLATVDGGRSVSNYRKNQKVFSQGDPADAVFYIQDGKVKVCVVSELGKEAVVALHDKGDFFGEGCLLGQPLRLATAAAVTECAIMRIGKAAMVRVLQDEPKFSERFMAYLLARNARVEEDLVDQLFNSSEKRLARTLLLMANFGKEGKPERVITKVSQEMLAEIIGSTRSQVSTFMNKFRRLGFIDYNGDLEVHNSLLSLVLHETPAIKIESETEKD
jgi:CRP/FNR family transcriptional regulator, cyclic AMP receptor protein